MEKEWLMKMWIFYTLTLLKSTESSQTMGFERRKILITIIFNYNYINDVHVWYEIIIHDDMNYMNGYMYDMKY